MNIFVAGGLWVAGAALVGGVIAYLVRRFGWDEGRPDNNDAAGQVFTIVGGLHAVLVEFVLISLFDSVGSVSQDAQTEADSLVAATWAADALPAETKDRVHQLAIAYAQTVEQQEGTRLAAHIIIVSTLAGTITLLLFAIYQLQNPFSGGAKVPSEAFSGALDRLA